MSEELVLNPGSVSHQSAQLAPNHIHQSQWLAANPEHQSTVKDASESQWLDRGAAEPERQAADNPLERLSRLGIDPQFITAFAGLRILTNPDQLDGGYDNLEFSSDVQRLQSHLSRVADLLETTYSPSPTIPGDYGIDLLVDNAKHAKQAGDSQIVKDQLIAGLIIKNCTWSSDDLIERVIAGGLAPELIEAVKDNKTLILATNPRDIEDIITPASILEQNRSLLELVVGHQLKIDKGDVDIGSELNQTDEIGQRIQALSVRDKGRACLSTEIGQRDPNLQKQLIETYVGLAGSFDGGHLPIAEMAKLRPDVFENALEEELRQIRATRVVKPTERHRFRMPCLDRAVLEAWEAGYHHLASQMLTVSEAEVGFSTQYPDGRLSDRGLLGRAVDSSKLARNPDRASVVLDEISQHIEQRRADLFNKVDQYIADFADNNQLDKDMSQEFSAWFKHSLAKNHIGDSADPEYYVELVTNLSAKLVKIADGPNRSLLRNLSSVQLSPEDNPGVLQTLETLQEDDLLKLMVDKDVCDAMVGILRSPATRIQSMTRLLTSKDFKDIVTDCQLNQADSYAVATIHNLTLVDVIDADEIISSFTDTNLAKMMDQLPESWRLELFHRVTKCPKSAAPLASSLTTLLATEDGSKLLAKSDSLLSANYIDNLLNWPIDKMADNAKNLLQALELIDTPALIENPYLLDYIKHGMFNALDQNYLEVAHRLTYLLTHPRSLWKNLYVASTEIMQMDPAQDRNSSHLISVLPKTEIDMGKLSSDRHFIDSVKGFRPIDVSDLSEDDLRATLADSENLSPQELQDFQQAIPFNRLTADAKRQIYAYQLYETVRRTRSDSYKQIADERNRQRLQGDQLNLLQIGDFMHSTSAQSLGGILQMGNLAGESRQLAPQEDAFPFNVDVSVIKEVEPEPYITIANTFGDIYGGNMSLVYDHNHSDWLRDKTVAVDRGLPSTLHALVLAGIPATEISAIVLEQPTALTIEETSRLIAENGFYIPLYDDAGRLELTPEAYDQLRSSYNMDKAKIDTVVDNYLDIEHQQGSNLGSEYYLPTDQGIERYYIKFGGLHSKDNYDVNGVDHVWTEFLADQLYRDYGLAVPDTKMVQIDGRIGRASKWLDANQPPSTAMTSYEDGFVMDAWIGNWDLVCTNGNIVPIGGANYRVDNGSALDIRAQGGRKSPEAWSQAVTELEIGDRRFGDMNGGMRHMYPSLTPQDFKRSSWSISRQISRWQNRSAGWFY